LSAERGPAPVAPAFGLWPPLLASMACTMAMMAFVALVGPVARVLGLQPWQAGLTVSDTLWMLLAPARGAARDRCGAARRCCSAWAACAWPTC
jgi:hypothetical protein